MGNVDVNVAAVDAAVHEATVQEQQQGVYLSGGKTPAEIQAAKDALEREENAPYCKITLTRQQYDDFEVASSNIVYLLHNDHSIFDMLQSGLSLGHFDPEDHGFTAIMEMVGRGFKSAAEDEGEKMDALSGLLRTAKELINDDK